MYVITNYLMVTKRDKEIIEKEKQEMIKEKEKLKTDKEKVKKKHSRQNFIFPPKKKSLSRQ